MTALVGMTFLYGCASRNKSGQLGAQRAVADIDRGMVALPTGILTTSFQASRCLWTRR